MTRRIRPRGRAARAARAFRDSRTAIHSIEQLESRQLLTAINSGERLTGNIALVGQTDTYTFDAAAHDAFSVVVGGLSGVNFFPRIQIIAPNGVPMNDPGVNWEFDTSNLALGGTYSILVRDDNSVHTGTYAVTMIRTPAAQLVDADSGPIASNERRTGSIDLGDQDVYTINASAGESISAVVGTTSGVNFFARVEVFAPNGVPLNGPGDAFAFDASNLPQTGTYYFVVRDDNNLQAGAYGLTVIKTPGAQSLDTDSGPIASNQRREGSIEPGDQDVYTITANAGESMSAVVGTTSGVNFFARVEVFAPNGVPLNGAGTDLAFDSSSLPQTGTYYLVVRDDNNLQAGSYALTVIKTPGAQSFDLDSGPIASNERREGIIELGDQDVYTFTANAGESVSAVVGTLGGVNFFPRIQLFTPSGVPLDAPAADYALDFSNLPQTGTYFVVVRDDNNLQAGQYGLTVIRTPGAQTLDADSGPIDSNQRRTGTIELGDQDVYTFSANAGDSVAAAVGGLTGVNFFPRIQLFAPNGVPLSAAGAAYTLDAQNLPLTGTYYLVVRDDNNLQAGRYSLSLARLPGAQVADTLDNDGGAIASGQSRTGAISAGDLDVYTINLTAGSSVTMRMGFLNGVNFFPRLDVFAPNGVRLASQVGLPAVITINPVPVDGTYYIVARDNNDLESGTYAIAIDAGLAPDTRPPQVTQTRFDFDAPRQQVVFTMNENVAASVAAGDLVLQNLTGSFTVPAANIVPSFNAAANEVVFQFQNYAFLALPDGDYRATLSAGSVVDTAGNPLASDASFDFFFLNGDANRSRAVTLQDFNRLAANFGLATRTFSQGDFNYDGVVNLQDFNILAARFGNALAGPDGAPSLPRFGNRPIVDDLRDVLG